MSPTPRALLLLGLVLAPPLLGADAGLPADSTDIVSDEAVASTVGAETTSVLTGHVVVTGQNLRMACDSLKAVTVSARAGAESRESFKHLLATGHVHIVEGALEATCGRAELFPDEQRMVLTENPVVTNHANGTVTAGETITAKGSGREYTVSVSHSHSVTPGMKNLLPGAEAPPAAAPAPKP